MGEVLGWTRLTDLAQLPTPDEKTSQKSFGQLS
jgi:hypothetical protein